ncbi:hypothetical protein NUW58_g2893 [Xylaria curta]|uniref:Uncharacterized protein n=1 Tax=Xylaria curta TaxID=42375 RepID=A0ACC1PFU3_9PEZI|nr:hypothetical protein NUW58_g2893 [Xylaria curta]
MPLFRPFVPYHVSSGQDKLIKFGGLLTTEFLEPPPGRSFMFRQTYRHNLDGPVPDNLQRLIDAGLKPTGPPLHIHRFQTEYSRVESGIMGIVDDKGHHHKVYPEDGEFIIPAGSLHRFHIHPDSPGEMTVCFSASDAGMDYQLDRVFFENWYGYWHDSLLHDGGMGLIQYLAIIDGGDMQAVPPAWVPFRKFVGYWGTVIIGRWIGGILGYKPYFREYTTDWDYAMAKLKTSRFQRHMVHESYNKGVPWDGYAALSKGKPTNAVLEPELTDLSGQSSHLNGVTTNGVDATTSGAQVLKPNGNVTKR